MSCRLNASASASWWVAGLLMTAAAVGTPTLAAEAPVEALRGELARCRVVAEPVARLKCYDLIATEGAPGRRGQATTAVPGAGGPPVAAGPAPPGAAPSGVAPGASAAPASAPTAAAPAAAAAAAAAAAFGLESGLPAPSVNELRSAIPGPFIGWDAKTRWKLANGQVWQVADGSRAFYRLESPAVRITRGVFGSFFMEIDGVSHAVPVRRLE